MTLATPYGQHNYMGEYSSDANALTFIRNQKWDDTQDGTGDPQDGMWYYNTTDHLIHEYHNGVWLTQWNPYGNDIHSTNGAFNMVVDGTNLMEFNATMTRMLAYLDMDGQRLIWDADADSYAEAFADDQIGFWAGGAERWRYGMGWLRMLNAGSFGLYNSGNGEIAYMLRNDNEWLRYCGTGGGYFTEVLQGYGYWQVKYNGGTTHFYIRKDSSQANCFIWHPDTYLYACGSPRQSMYVDSTGHFGYQSSALRFKKNILSQTSPDWLYALRPVTFNLKTDANNEYPEFGFIAEEVEQVLNDNGLNPIHLVTYDLEGEILGVTYENLVSVLVKALQDQKARCDDLEARLAALEEVVYG